MSNEIPGFTYMTIEKALLWQKLTKDQRDFIIFTRLTMNEITRKAL